MTPDEQAQAHVDAFFAAVEPIKDAYSNETFSFAALKSGNDFVIIQARLFLNVAPMKDNPPHFESANVRAGQYFIKDLKLNAREIIAALIAGGLDTPHGKLLFPGNQGRYGTVFQPYHADGLITRSRFTHLTIWGAPMRDYLRQPDLDWELRAAPTTFDGLADLLIEYHPGNLGDLIRVEVVGFNAVHVDFGCVVDGETAKVAIIAPTTIDTARIEVGCRVMENGKVIRRTRIPGKELTWAPNNGTQRGAVEFTVPRAAVVQATAIYNGVAQQYYAFGDPNSFQNPRRAAYEAFDPKFAIFDDILARTIGVKPDARDFEAAIPWLFWMLGFAPAALVGTKTMSAAPDALMSPPNGNIIVLESTVGLLKDDSKLPRLHDRVQAVKRKLEHTSTTHIKVLPVIVTAKTADEIKPDLEQAASLGIYVIAREDIEALKQRTLLPPNADQLYDEAVRSLASGGDF